MCGWRWRWCRKWQVSWAEGVNLISEVGAEMRAVCWPPVFALVC
jgi:hypothetical protein